MITKRSSTSMIDLVFLMLLSFVAMFIISFLMINPISKKEDVKLKEQYMIVLTWNDESTSDIDLWLKSPAGVVGFNNKQNTLSYLDKDDLGDVTEVVYVNGTPQTIKKNREIIYIKTYVPGEYVVNVHGFKIVNENLNQNVKVELIRLMPEYRVEYIRKLNFNLEPRQEYTMFSFILPENKELKPIINTTEQYDIVQERTNFYE